MFSLMFHLTLAPLTLKKNRFCRAFSTLRPFGLLYYYPQQVPAFISRDATHHTDARDLYQRRRELLPMNFASRSVIYENPLGSFTRHKAWTWDILFYFPSEGRHTEDFPDARKIQRLRPGLNPRTRVPVPSMLTIRPPKPSSMALLCWLRLKWISFESEIMGRIWGLFPSRAAEP